MSQRKFLEKFRRAVMPQCHKLHSLQVDNGVQGVKFVSRVNTCERKEAEALLGRRRNKAYTTVQLSCGQCNARVDKVTGGWGGEVGALEYGLKSCLSEWPRSGPKGWAFTPNSLSHGMTLLQEGGLLPQASPHLQRVGGLSAACPLHSWVASPFEGESGWPISMSTTRACKMMAVLKLPLIYFSVKNLFILLYINYKCAVQYGLIHMSIHVTKPSQLRTLSPLL